MCMIYSTLYGMTFLAVSSSELIARWATNFYQFTESQIAGTVELVTESKFEVNQVSIQGFPKQIPDGHPNHFPNAVVTGPCFPGKRDSLAK